MVVDAAVCLFWAEQVIPCDHSLKAQEELLVSVRLFILSASGILEVISTLLKCLICPEQLLLHILGRLDFEKAAEFFLVAEKLSDALLDGLVEVTVAGI